MANLFCQQCGQSCPPTLRLCPACGGRSLAISRPLDQAHSLQSSAKAPSPSVSGRQQPINSPPRLPVDPTVVGGDHKVLAGRWPRLFANVIDTFLVALASSVVSALGNLVSTQGATGEALYGGILVLSSALLPFFYFTYFHRGPNGSTLGKRLFGLKVVMQSGAGLSTITAFVRVFLTLIVPVGGILVLGGAAILPAASELPSLQLMGGLVAVMAIMICLLGPYATIFFTDQRLSIYDMICKTIVIKREVA